MHHVTDSPAILPAKQGRRKVQFIFWLCFFLTLAKVFTYSAAFPFFNNVDEQAHFDVTVKYAKWQLPHKHLNHYEAESAEIIVTNWSQEFLANPELTDPTVTIVPLWRLEHDESAPIIRERAQKLGEELNHEAFSPPAYYLLAGTWYDLGKNLFGLTGGYLLYWTRFLNLGIVGALFWLTHLLCTKMFAADYTTELCIMLLLAAFPQDVFYSINADVLSPLACLTAIYLLIRFYSGKDHSSLFAILSGLAVATAVLIKYSNMPMLIMPILFLVMKARQNIKRGISDQWTHQYLPLLAACTLPLAAWFGWNTYALGDALGSTEKLHELGWTLKPLHDFFDHPLFTVKGIIFFVTELQKTFWRGEIIWGLNPMTLPGLDLLYVITSDVFILASIITALFNRSSTSENERLVYLLSGIMLATYTVFLALLSLIYDFGNGWYPSRNYPYITSGRLVLGCLIPFMILYVNGMKIVFSIISRRLSTTVFCALLGVVILVVQAYLMVPVMHSPFNWFHMLTAQ